MISLRCLVGLSAALLTTAASAQMQSAPRSRARADQNTFNLRQSPRLVSPSMQSRGALGTFETSRYHGITTRPDQLRSMLPQRYYPRLPNRGLDTRPSPIKSLLDQRNLLSTRSALARRTGALVGRHDFTVDESGKMPGDFSQIEKRAMTTTAPVDPLKPDDGRYGDAIVARLKVKADEYHQIAISAFQKGQFIQARDYFDLLRDVEPNSTRPYIGNTIVSVQRSDFGTGAQNLLRVFELMHTLDDGKTDTTRFYKSPEDFNRRVEVINYAAQKFKDNPAPNILLAYFSWIKGDVGTAIDAAAKAEKLCPPPNNEPVKKFRELLIQQRTASAGAAK